MNATTDPIQMLLDDHQRVRDLFQQLQSDGQGGQTEQVARQILMELQVHSKLEEEIFYPAFRQQGNAEDKELIAEAYDEHAEVDQMVTQLMGMGPSEAQFMPMMRKLQQDVEHHVQEEETEMLPKAREELRGQLDRLGQEMMQRKQQLMTQLQGSMSGSTRQT